VLIVLNVATAFCVEASLTYMVEAAAERAKQRTGGTGGIVQPTKGAHHGAQHGSDVMSEGTSDGTSDGTAGVHDDAAESTGARMDFTGVWRWLGRIAHGV